MSLSLEVLHVPDCPNLAPLLERLHQVTDLAVATREISTNQEAAATGMAGSPTLLINGTDPFGAPGQCDCGLSCRLYRDQGGRIVPAPSVKQLRHAIAAAEHPAAPNETPNGAPNGAPGDVLSAWRTRAIPLDPQDKAVHQAILRTFADTGHPPALAELDSVAVASDSARGARSAAEVLRTLHDADAVRLTPDGQIALAYPFSATPTRHRVRIGDHVDVYAMCAIDALGIAAMLGQDTRIESVDITTGRPVTVTMTGGKATWEPAEAVVFIGADAGGGPSVDCCCDYLNFFVDQSAAQAWTSSHPQVPGQILDQAAAEDLGTNLFQPLLAR
jgi:hypothetical protein